MDVARAGFSGVCDQLKSVAHRTAPSRRSRRSRRRGKAGSKSLHRRQLCLSWKRQAAPSCNRAAAPRRSSFPTFPLWWLERAAAASRLTIPTSSTLPIWAAGREARTRGGDPDAVQTLTRGVLRPCRPRRTHARTDGRTHARTHVPPAASPLFSSPSRRWPRPPPPPRPSLRGPGSRPALRRRSLRSWPL